MNYENTLNDQLDNLNKNIDFVNKGGAAKTHSYNRRKNKG